MKKNISDSELIHLLKTKLFTALVGDVMDEAGLQRQFLPAHIQPLTPHTLLAGRAMPVLEADCFGDHLSSNPKAGPFGLMFDALDDLKQGEIYICTGSSPHYALWGELMSLRAIELKAAGAVLDGYVRDTRGILNLKFPTFCTGSYAQDQRVRGRVIDYRCRIEFSNGTIVTPGDILFGDIDGVLVIPKVHEKEIIHEALNKIQGENQARKLILQGMSVKKIFETIGVM